MTRRAHGQLRAASKNHVSTRLDESTVARLDALALRLVQLGAKPSRSVAVRKCILTGLELLEARDATG